MVDPVSGAGGVPGNKIQNISKNSQQESKTEQSAKSTPIDEVQISGEALSLSDAQSSATELAQILSRTGFSLGLDPAFE